MPRRLLWTTLALVLAFAAPAQAQGIIHPQAIEQPTLRGQSIHTLALYDGKLYSGYGDYGANTGPIVLNPLDPETNTFLGPEATLRTEAVEALRVLDGRLYAPYTDPMGLGPGTPDYAVDGVPVNGFDSAHVFDMTATPGNLWAAGSGPPDDGIVWRSTDNGATWQESLRVPVTNPSNPIRFYFIAATNGRVYAQPTPWNNLPMTGYVWQNGAWHERPPLATWPQHGEEFANQLVYQGNPGCCLSTLNGELRRESTDFAVAGGVLYSLEGQRVYQTTDLETWTLAARVSRTAISIEVVDGRVWYGTYDARIARAKR
jgi:hypothetical protein